MTPFEIAPRLRHTPIMRSNERPLSTNSRGPRSPSGKEASSHNQIKHGLAATAIVLPSEDDEEWERFHEDVRLRFDAEGPVESALASRVAELLWRLRRAARAEAQSVSVGQMHRDVSVYAREQRQSMTGPVLSQAEQADHDIGADAEAQQQPAPRRSFYADAIAVSSATSRYLETLPVLLPDDSALEKIMRYEAHLSRLLKHALHELEALQDRRRGTATPLARIDID